MFGALPACKPGILDDSRIRLEARHLRDLPSPCTKMSESAVLVAPGVDACRAFVPPDLLCVAMQMFGPYAAMKLCEMTDSVLLDSLGQLDSCLNRWKELLDPITLAVVVSVWRAGGGGAGAGDLAVEFEHMHRAGCVGRQK